MKYFCFFFYFFFSDTGFGWTANWVRWEFHPGFYRIIFEYTIPELKEKRQAVMELKNKKKADEIYSAILRGGDFFLDGQKIIFEKNSLKQKPW